jgi:hypothetical protein
MDTMMAMQMAQKNVGKPQMVFDWVKAAKLIKEKNPQEVEAGLKGDWEYTGGTIYENKRIVKDSYTYLSSNWAVPEIKIDGVYMDCFVMEDKTEWSSETKWPKEPLEILGVEV